MGIFSDKKYRPSESRILATALTFSFVYFQFYLFAWALVSFLKTYQIIM